MNLFIDCEFNGFNGELISMAIVAENGEYFYQSLPLPPNVEPWVKENVISVLDMEPVEKEVFQIKLYQFLNSFGRVHLIADWPDDIKYFCQWVITGPGQCMNLPPITMEIDRSIDIESAVPHNALSDAFAIMSEHIGARYEQKAT